MLLTLTLLYFAVRAYTDKKLFCEAPNCSFPQDPHYNLMAITVSNNNYNYPSFLYWFFTHINLFEPQSSLLRPTQFMKEEMVSHRVQFLSRSHSL